MLLCARNSSNTAQHLLRYGKCALNFLPDDRRFFKEAVRHGLSGRQAGREDEGLHLHARRRPDGRREPGRSFFPRSIAEAYPGHGVHLDAGARPRAGRQARRARTGIPGPYPRFQRHHLEIRRAFHPARRQDPDEGALLQRDPERREGRAISRTCRSTTATATASISGIRSSAARTPSCCRCARPRSRRFATRPTGHRRRPSNSPTRPARSSLKVPRIFLPTALKGCVAWAKEHSVTLDHSRAHGYHQRQAQQGKRKMNISGLKGGRCG
jgi:hypothetical protein